MADPIPYVVETSAEAASAPEGSIPIALYGGETGDKAEINALATVATANASDLATAITLVNALKARLNEVITALKA
jgi:hypothetical protein